MDSRFGLRGVVELHQAGTGVEEHPKKGGLQTLTFFSIQWNFFAVFSNQFHTFQCILTFVHSVFCKQWSEWSSFRLLSSSCLTLHIIAAFGASGVSCKTSSEQLE